MAVDLNRLPFIKPALVFLLLALAWDASGLDLAVMQQLGSPGGFPLKDQPLWSLWLHERGKQLALLARRYGVAEPATAGSTRIGLQLAQEELAQLLGASRQRVNQELKAMERDSVIRIEPSGIVVRNRDGLRRIVEAEAERA